MRRFHPFRHRRLWLVLLLAVGLLALVGGLVPGVRVLGVRGFLCAYHGAKVWMDLRRHHPLWSAWHLYRATHDCKAAPWRY